MKKKKQQKPLDAETARLYAEQRRLELGDEIFEEILKRVQERSEGGHMSLRIDYNNDCWPEESVKRAVQSLLCAKYKVIAPESRCILFISWRGR